MYLVTNTNQIHSTLGEGGSEPLYVQWDADENSQGSGGVFFWCSRSETESEMIGRGRRPPDFAGSWSFFILHRGETMAQTAQTASKSTGGAAPKEGLAKKASRRTMLLTYADARRLHIEAVNEAILHQDEDDAAKRERLDEDYRSASAKRKTVEGTFNGKKFAKVVPAVAHHANWRFEEFTKKDLKKPRAKECARCGW